jgi:hypothetical protein
MEFAIMKSDEMVKNVEVGKFSLANVQEHTPPPLESQETATEPLGAVAVSRLVGLIFLLLGCAVYCGENQTCESPRQSLALQYRAENFRPCIPLLDRIGTQCSQSTNLQQTWRERNRRYRLAQSTANRLLV